MRFREFSQKWQKKQFICLAKAKARIGWQGLRQDEFMDSGDYYLITGTDFLSDRIKFDTCKYISKYRYEQDPNIQVKNGDILVTKDGSIGKVAFVQDLDKPATLNAGVYVIRSIKDLSQEFLFHYLKAPFLLNFSSKASTGGTIKHLNQSVLEKFEIPYSSTKEQEKIATFLTTIDKRIETQSKIINKYKSFINVIRDYIVTSYANWTWCKLSDLISSNIITLRRGNIIPKHNADSEYCYPVYSSSVQNEGLMGYSNNFMFDKALITWSIDGGGDIFYREKHKFSVTNVCGILELDETKYNYRFVAEILKHQHSKMLFDYQTKAHPSVIEKLYKLPIVPVEKQNQITNIFNALYSRLKNEESYLNKLKEQKKYLLSNMFI